MIRGGLMIFATALLVVVLILVVAPTQQHRHGTPTHTVLILPAGTCQQGPFDLHPSCGPVLQLPTE